jgi:hypothetical protein
VMVALKASTEHWELEREEKFVRVSL